MTRVTSKAAKSRKTKQNARVLHLVPPTISEDTIEMLEALLDEARCGRIIGLAFAAIRPMKDYAVDTAGVARADPTFARGAVVLLDDLLRDDVSNIRAKD